MNVYTKELVKYNFASEIRVEVEFFAKGECATKRRGKSSINIIIVVKFQLSC